MRTLTNAKHVRLPIRMTPTSRHGKTNSSVMGWRVCRNKIMWWMTMLMEEKPKNPNFFGPLSLIWKNVEFLSHYPPQRILWVMSFLRHRSNNRTYAYSSEAAGQGGPYQEFAYSRQDTASSIYHRCVHRCRNHCVGVIAGTAYSECSCSYSYLLAWWDQGRA